MSDEERERVLQRVRKALQQVSEAESGDLPRAYRHPDERDHQEIVHEFIERVREYRARVQEIVEADLPGVLTATCGEYRIKSLLIAPGFPQAWRPESMPLPGDDPPLSYEELDACAGVLTTCRLGIAQTGTIVLDGGPGQGRRALSLLPDYHLCLIREAQIVGQVSEAICALQESRERPLTFLSGPSATSDIELKRVVGVHGPRTLQVFVIRAPLKRQERKEPGVGGDQAAD